MRVAWFGESAQPDGLQSFEKPLHTQKVTFSCVLWVEGISGRYLFKNEVGHFVLVNGKCCIGIINDFCLDVWMDRQQTNQFIEVNLC